MTVTKLTYLDMLQNRSALNEQSMDTCLDELANLERKLLTYNKYQFIKGTEKDDLSYAAYSIKLTNHTTEPSYLEIREIVLLTSYSHSIIGVIANFED